MRFEGDGDDLCRSALSGNAAGDADELAMAAMNAVKVADGQHDAFERRLK